MPTTKAIFVTTYTFDELSDKAKARAREWYREGNDFFSEHVIDDAANMARILGIDLDAKGEPQIYWSGFGSQGDGASFVGEYRCRPEACEEIMHAAPQDEELYRIACGLEACNGEEEPWANIEHGSSHYCHERSVRIVAQCDTVAELLRDFMRWIYRQLEAEYNYQNSDEQVDEVIRVNECEFTVDGQRGT